MMDGVAGPLVAAIQELALAQSRRGVIETLASSARALIGADGTTVVFRDGDQCFYVHEDAMAPLFAPNRFPMDACVSGWVMKNAKSTLIDDVYDDPRVPIAVYRPTFVKSMGMVPIRSREPIGALGFYWASRHRMSDDELARAQALADSAAVALQNVATLENLEERVRERTEQLTLTNRDLRLFAGNVAHDLRSPLTVLISDAQLLQEEGLQEGDRLELAREVETTAAHMNRMLAGLLELTQVTSRPIQPALIDLSRLATDAVQVLRRADPARSVEVQIEPDLRTHADEGMMRIVLGNLLNNAWKFTARASAPRIRFGVEKQAFVVQDNGAGFDAGGKKLFEAFQRFHRNSDYPGTGLGLTTVYRAINRHGGSLWAESALGAGARFYFSIPHAA